MATKQQVEKYRSQSKWFWNSIFIGIPVLVIAYVAIDMVANLITGNFLRRVGEVGLGMLVLSVILGFILRKWVVVQTSYTSSTPYEDKLAEYWTWFAARNEMSLRDEEAWHRGEISYKELNNRDAEFKRSADEYWNAIQEFRYAKLSNNMLVYHDRDENE